MKIRTGRVLREEGEKDEKKNEMRPEWSKEFNERFLSCLLAVNIADGRKGIQALVWSWI